jgi:hypothetical protein
MPQEIIMLGAPNPFHSKGSARDKTSAEEKSSAPLVKFCYTTKRSTSDAIHVQELEV